MGSISQRNTSDQYIAAIILHSLASSVIREGVSAETVVLTLQRFRAQLNQLIDACRPVWSNVDVAHAQCFWAAEEPAAGLLTKTLQGLEQLRRRTDGWLIAEGFSELQISVGIDTGLVIFSDHEALGTTVTSASEFATFGLERQGVIVASYEVVSLLNFDWAKRFGCVDIDVRGVTNKRRQVVVSPMHAFQHRAG